MSEVDPRKLLEEALMKYGAKYNIDERFAKILAFLAESPRTFKEVMEYVDIPRGTLQRRWEQLEKMGLIRRIDTKRKSFYEPRRIYAIDPIGFGNLLRNVLRDMEEEREKLKAYIPLFKALIHRINEIVLTG